MRLPIPLLQRAVVQMAEPKRVCGTIGKDYPVFGSSMHQSVLAPSALGILFCIGVSRFLKAGPK
jgi:hypothetical protein